MGNLALPFLLPPLAAVVVVAAVVAVGAVAVAVVAEWWQWGRWRQSAAFISRPTGCSLWCHHHICFDVAVAITATTP